MQVGVSKRGRVFFLIFYGARTILEEGKLISRQANLFFILRKINPAFFCAEMFFDLLRSNL